ncbi:hypothetical protein PT274_04475 [Leuconostocaceae bacterium ESL0958]|nr:hypothetical protein [Leuconostocaceae bacterium ESL0958]
MLILKKQLHPLRAASALAAFLVLALLLRFNETTVTVLNSALSILAQLMVIGPLQGVFSCLRFLSTWPMLVLDSLLWAAFLWFLNFRLGAVWSLIVQGLLALLALLTSLLVSLTFAGGMAAVQTMPDVGLVLLAQLCLQIDHIVVRRLSDQGHKKAVCQTLLVLFWLGAALAQVALANVDGLSALGAWLLAYWFYQKTARAYLRRAAHWQKQFQVDGQI